MYLFWGVLSAGCAVLGFVAIGNQGNIVLPWILSGVFGLFFAASWARQQDRRKQTEINDRLARLEELRQPVPAAPASTVPVGHVRKQIGGHQVDVPADPPPRPIRLSNPGAQGHR